MQSALAIGCLVLVAALRVQVTDSAFTSGSTYRQSWGYKRSSNNLSRLFDLPIVTPGDQERSQFSIQTGDLVDRMSNPLIAKFIVETLIDVNGDGLVTGDELLGVRR